MKITVTGSLGNIGRPLTNELLSQGHEVQVISSSVDRKMQIEKLGAIPLIGSVSDSAFIENAFAGSDAVYLMIPPNPLATDVKAYIERTGAIYAEAIRKNAIPVAVNLSSIGSVKAGGGGPTSSNYLVENYLNEIPELSVTHLRPGIFMTNFYGSIPLIRQLKMIGNNFPGDILLPLSHPNDIARIAADSLTARGNYQKVIYVISDIHTGSSVAETIASEIEMPGLVWKEFSDEELMEALLREGFSVEMAKVYIIEIGKDIRQGKLTEEVKAIPKVDGVSLEQFAKEFAFAYWQAEAR